MTANCIQKNCASLRRVCAVALALCIALGALSLPVSARADAASFVQVSLAGANAYDSANAATILQAGTVLMLQNPVKAAYNGQEYYYVYYNSAVYHILATEVSPISEADAQTYVRNNLWTSTAFTTLKRELNLTGEIRVYALQLALKTLGYYSDSLDGSYGKGTEKAVYKFQRANGLTKDGDAGPLTQQALFALARNKGTSSGSSSGSGSSSSGSSSSGTTGTMGTSGTLRTVASVNLREKATQNSAKLASVPVNSVLTYYNTSVSGGVTWYQVLYNNKNGWLMGTYVNVTSSSTGTASGTLTTTAKVNLRKSSSKSSVRLGVVPMGVKLAYIDAKTSGGVTWYKVSYGVNTGWLMGTYVNASGSGSSSGGNSGSGGSSSGSVTVTGKVEITKVSTRVRKTPGGAKTGVVLAKGSVVEMIGASVSSGGYTWYPVRTGSVTGYVRGDCATVVGNSGNTGGGSTAVNPRKYITLPMNTSLYTTANRSVVAVTAPQGAVVQMASDTTVTGTDSAVYCSLYYQSKLYYALYSDVSSGVMSDTQLAAYVLQLWNSTMNDKFYNDGTLVGDVRVYAMQLGLYVLGYYTGALDGTYGAASEAAVKNFQRAQKLDRDGVMGVNTWAAMANLAKQVSNGSASSGVTPNPGGGGSSGGGSTTVTDFGTITSITKPTWTQADEGNYWPKYTFATVLDITSGKVFTIYRTGGTNHPDAVPYTEADTKAMCEAVGFTYPARRPNSDELAKIVADNSNNNANYTWPDYSGKLTGVTKIGSAWDRRPALLNVNGKVYAVSIYGWPHGFMGIGAKDGLSTQKFPNGKLLYENNNFYGCFCVRFYNSAGHGSANQTVINQHNAAADQAYNYAKQKWPSLCK